MAQLHSNQGFPMPVQPHKAAPKIVKSVITPPSPTNGWQKIELSKFHDPRGNLSVIQSELDVPFNINRVYYLYDVPGGASRAGHANRRCHQFLVAMTGSFDVHLQNGDKKESFHLNRSYYGLYIPPMTWRDIDNFSSGAVCMALSSHPYDPEDYYRDYDEYLAALDTSQ